MMTRHDGPPVHVVTDDATLRRPDFGEVALALLRSGADQVALHIRGHATDGAVLERLARSVSSCRTAGGWLVINDRIDIAGVVAADGVQLGHRSLPVDVARRLLPDVRIGASVHGVDSARAACDADWLVLGTIYETASHPGRAAAGPEHLERVARVVDRPILAIGGITPRNIGEVRRAGASGVAVSSGVWGASDPASALGDYLTAWASAA